MPQLANNDVAALFIISADDWKAINKRVGAVMAVSLIQEDVTAYIPAYPDLRQHSTVWQINMFPGLITQSVELANYATKAINSFSELNKAIKQLGQASKVPLELQILTMLCLQKLKDDTSLLANSFDVLSMLLLMFFNDNKQVDLQIAKNKDKLDIFWKPLGQTITSLEQGVGRVTSVWNAITDDLHHAISAPVNVTRPFLEVLNLDAAILNWQTVQKEADAFADKVEGQTKYWFNPFQD